MITLDNYVRPESNVIGTIVDDEAVLILPPQGQIKVLNEVGARVWSLADGTRTVSDIAAAICAEYDVAPDEAESDILAFVTELVERGIVSISATPPRDL